MNRSWQHMFGDGPVILDGGLSTQLADQDTSGALWTGRVLLENPAAVTRAHADFVAAGADVVISASYQISRDGFVREGLSRADADAALRASTQAARAAVEGTRVLVAASVGPYGAILHDGSEYRGNYGRTRRELSDFHAERLQVLVDSAPDLLAVETIPDLLEAEAIVEVLAEQESLPAWMTFSAVDGAHVCAGQRIEEAVAVAASCPSIIGVGINCTDPRYITELVGRIAAVTPLPVVVYPNAGGVWDAEREAWQGAEDGWAFPQEWVEEWAAAGARAIGGCCGTDADAIRLIAQARTRT